MEKPPWPGTSAALLSGMRHPQGWPGAVLMKNRWETVIFLYHSVKRRMVDGL